MYVCMYVCMYVYTPRPYVHLLFHLAGVYRGTPGYTPVQWSLCPCQNPCPPMQWRIGRKSCIGSYRAVFNMVDQVQHSRTTKVVQQNFLMEGNLLANNVQRGEILRIIL